MMASTEDLYKSVNQLSSLVVGRTMALETNDLADDPLQRIEELIKLATAEISTAAIEGDNKLMKQGQRKLESLSSLKTISEALYEFLDVV